MGSDLIVLAMAKGLAHHASTRMSLAAQNVANADTVGYRARKVAAFDAVYTGPGAPERGPGDAPRLQGGFTAAATRPGHVGYSEASAVATPVYEAHREGALSPNGNSVSIEEQLARGAEAKIDHELALGVLRKSMDLIRMSFGRK